MANNFKFNTDDAVKEVKVLITELKELKKTLEGVSKTSQSAFGVTATSMNNLKKTITKLNKSVRRLGDLVKTNSKRLTRNSNEIKRNADLTKTNSKNTRSLTNSIKKNTDALNKDTKATEKNTKAKGKSTKGGLKMLRMLGAMAGALGFVGVIKAIGNTIQSLIKLTIRFESLGFALEKISGNALENIRAMQFLMELNDNFGAKLSETTERWLKFRAAARQSGLTLIETKKVFQSVTKASALLGLRTDELRGIYLALEQMLSKGKVTTEELRRQLGERLPGAMGIMADAMGVTLPQLDKMMKKGEVLSAVVLPKFAEELEKAYGMESLEKIENLATAVGKMEGAWDRFVFTVSEGDSIISKAIGGTMKFITEALNAITNYLENYEQTARRTSNIRFGESVGNQLSTRIEDRLKEANALEKTEKELKAVLKLRQEETAATEKGSDERIEALKKESEAMKELLKLQKIKADEGRLYAIERLPDEQKILDVIKKETDEALKLLNIEKQKDFSSKAGGVNGIRNSGHGVIRKTK